MDYKNVSTRVRRFKNRLDQNQGLKQIAEDCMKHMTNDET